jgi:hypothetical protein
VTANPVQVAIACFALGMVLQALLMLGGRFRRGRARPDCRPGPELGLAHEGDPCAHEPAGARLRLVPFAISMIPLAAGPVEPDPPVPDAVKKPVRAKRRRGR